jgi:hypothetical protein
MIKREFYSSDNHEGGEIESVQKVFENEFEVEFGVMAHGAPITPEQSSEILLGPLVQPTLFSKGWVDNAGNPLIDFKFDVSMTKVGEHGYAYVIKYYRSVTSN